MYIHTNQLDQSNNERGMMTDQDLKAHVEAREAFIKREQQTFTELQKEFTKRNINKLDEIATQSDLNVLHLKAFAIAQEHCCDPAGLQEVLRRIATKEIYYRADKWGGTGRTVYHAVHLDNTQYKTHKKDAYEYWTKNKAQIVIDRVLSVYDDKETALNELTTLFKDINRHSNIDSRSIYNLPTRF